MKIEEFLDRVKNIYEQEEGEKELSQEEKDAEMADLIMQQLSRAFPMYSWALIGDNMINTAERERIVFVVEGDELVMTISGLDKRKSLGKFKSPEEASEIVKTVLFPPHEEDK